MVAGPGWKGQTPKRITKVIEAETRLVSVVGRTQLFNSADLEAVKKIQAQYQVQTLSAFLGVAPPPAVPTPAWVKPVPAAEMKTSLPPDVRAAFQAGMTQGQKSIDARRAATNGKSDDLFGTREFLRNDWVARATGAQMGIGANSREEALYPILEKDSSGQLLDGSEAKYILHFAKGAFPPVNAFWSLTMYNLPQQLLVKNPINRYLINSPMLPNLQLDADGGLTIYIQADAPGDDKQANWLPSPKGPFMMAMRFYYPKPALLQGEWKSPVVERVK
jgi:hypothetical protein